MANTLKILLILIIFSLASCSKGEKDAKGAKEIIKDYSKTLSTAPEKARDASSDVEKRDAAVTETLKELEK